MPRANPFEATEYYSSRLELRLRPSEHEAITAESERLEITATAMIRLSLKVWFDLPKAERAKLAKS